MVRSVIVFLPWLRIKEDSFTHATDWTWNRPDA